jgi:HEPN domain-containing protein
MPSRDELVRELTNQWLDKAGDDLNAAQALFDHGAELWSIVAFHCQQSVEKFLKAMLTSLQVEFSKTHDIAVLLDSLEGRDGDFAQELRLAEILTVYGVQVRYPGDSPEVDREEAEQALNLAKDVATGISAKLGR